MQRGYSWAAGLAVLLLVVACKDDGDPGADSDAGSSSEGGGGDSGAHAPTGGVVSTLASGLQNPIGLAVDATNLYFFTQPTENALDGAILKLPLSGGTVTTLVSNVGPIAIAVSATDLYWSQGDGSLCRVPIAGGKVSTIAASGDATGATPGASSLALSATDAYWIYGPDTALRKVPLDGGTVTTLYTDSTGDIFNDLALSATDVFWTQPGGMVRSVPLAGGTVTTLFSGAGNPEAIAVDGASVYWSDTTNETIVKTPLGGGALTTLAHSTPDDPERSAVSDPVALAVDATNVYWVNAGNASLVAVPIGGGTPTTLAQSSSSTNVSFSTSVVVDAQSAYFTGGEDMVEKLTPK